ncbi:MAG: S1C family serine protease [Chakrabartia sp.]
MAKPVLTADQVLSEAARYTVKVQVLNDIAFNQDESGARSGTGFLIDRKRGWLLTNAHVATRSPSVVKVAFRGGPQIAARRIHVDALIDLAVLAVPPEKIPATAVEAPLGCDKLPRPGASVFAYGHPWGMSYTATRGVVSGLAWFYPSQQIQTDAVINSGNSGGPLIDVGTGRVIGINTSTYKEDQNDKNATAVGLAEPMPPICRVVDLLKQGADAGLKMLPLATATSGDDLRPRVAQLYDLTVALQPGDIITRVNGGADVTDFGDLLSHLRGLSNRVTLTVARKGALVDVEVPLWSAPDPLKVRSINLAGLIISEPWRLDDIEVNPQRTLIVDWYQSGEDAALTDAEVSDFIVSVDGQPFSSTVALYAYLARLPDEAPIEIIVKRAASASAFYREYRHIVLTKTKLEWLAADADADES